ncbi:cytochrome oxidase putative small subunit CydP [Pseudomonas sp. NPDC007930]|uniref:cytochrome oxidase putative small subunit CydP n=1 Tax=Pseudomonas sp. NPDC007930 TaxID=3364417 RepID=UPI0036E88ACE
MAAHFAFLKSPLAKEIAVILLLKLVLIMGIKSLWFSTPPQVQSSTAVGQHLLAPPSVTPENLPK